MLAAETHLDATTQELNRAFLTQYPQKGARYLEAMPPGDAAAVLRAQPYYVVRSIWKYLPAGTSDSIFSQYPAAVAAELIQHFDSHIAVALLSRLPSDSRNAVLKELSGRNPGLTRELEELLDYPEDTAARLMDSHVQAFDDTVSVGDALRQLKMRKVKTADVLFLVNQEQELIGEVDLTRLVVADNSAPLATIAAPVKTTLNALDHKDLVIEKFEGYRTVAIPVLDANNQLIGVIRSIDMYQTTKEDLVSDIQSMVGAGKEEKALSSSWLAVTKRLPWLQINLLTAFAAAAVVGAFENLIAEVTALAILLPVAAGQSGNAGAQALAVTMRGLTLREISTRHWLRVMMKEMRAGFINGTAIAVTCGFFVYLWSHSIGLSLVIALAMVSSLVIACSSGALVPIMLKKFGLDPAQSSSIVLTTITDIAGFMSFLGIALLLSDMLPKG